MRRRDYLFLAAMVVVNGMLFFFEPDVKTPMAALGYGLFAVVMTFVVLKYVVRRGYD